MNTDDLTKMALAGLLGGSLLLTGCSATDDVVTDAGTGAATTTAGDTGGALDGDAGGDAGGGDMVFTEVHDCAGKNVCKGLGGCKVSAEKLEKLAEKMGVPMDKAGSPHDCAGLNECKGLGGCGVTPAKFKKLKAKVDAGK